MNTYKFTIDIQGHEIEVKGIAKNIVQARKKATDGYSVPVKIVREEKMPKC